MTTLALPMSDQSNVKIVQTFSKESRRLLNFIKQRVPTNEDAEDILQDVMYEFVNTFRVMKPVEQVSAWLFRVVRNRITDLFRKKRPEALGSATAVPTDDGESLLLEDLLPSPDAGPEEVYARKILFEELDAALDELPEEPAKYLSPTNWRGAASKTLPRRRDCP